MSPERPRHHSLRVLADRNGVAAVTEGVAFRWNRAYVRLRSLGLSSSGVRVEWGNVMRRYVRRAVLVVGTLAGAAVLAAAAPAATYVRNVPSTGSGVFHAGVPGSPAFQDPEFPGGGDAVDPDAAKVAAGGRHTSVINRSLTRGTGA